MEVGSWSGSDDGLIVSEGDRRRAVSDGESCFTDSSPLVTGTGDSSSCEEQTEATAGWFAELPTDVRYVSLDFDERFPALLERRVRSVSAITSSVYDDTETNGSSS